MGYFSFFGCKVFKIGHEKIGLTVTASPIFLCNLLSINVDLQNAFFLPLR